MGFQNAIRRLTPFPWPLWLVMLTAFGLRTLSLNAQSLWYDEAFSVVVARADLATAIRLLVADLHPPLYYFVLRAGITLFGSSEFAVRFVSLVPGMMLVSFAWALARRLFDRPTAWLAAALVSLSPLLVWYSREARMYSQATAFGLVATYSLVRAQDTGRAGWWAGFAACALGAIYSHYSALYLVAALGVFELTYLKSRISNPLKREILKSQRGWQLLRWDAVAWGAVAIGVIVVAPHLLGFSQVSRAYWPGRLDVPSALVKGARVLIDGHTGTPEVSDALAVLCGVLALVAILGAVASPSIHRGVGLASSILFVGLTLTFIVLYRQPKFEPRHLITLAPAMWLLAAVGIRMLWRNRVRVAAVLAGVALTSGLVVSDVGMLAGVAARDDWRGAVAYVRQNIRPDETLVLVSGHAFPALAYYNAPPWVALPDDLVLDVTHVLDYRAVASVLNRIQAERRGVWLALWQEDILDPTQIVPALLSDIGTELPVGAQFNGVHLRHFALDHPAAFPPDPPVARRLDQSPLPGLTALGVTLTPQPLPADVPLSVRMFWSTDASVPGVAGGSLRILDGQGQEWARRDYSLGGLFLSERWPPGQAVMGQYTITLPIGAPPGTYSLRQVVYRGSQTGVLDLGDLAVTRPLRMPDVAALGISPVALAHFGDLTLLSVGLEQQTVEPCRSLSFTLLWRAERPPTDNHTLWVNFAGQVADQLLAPGFSTSQWQPGDVWRTRHHIAAPCRAPDGPADLQLTLLNSVGWPAAAPVNAGTVSINGGRVFVPPAMQHSLYADLGSQVRLLGYDIQSPISNLQSPIEVTLYWQATREMTQSLTVFVHVEGERVWGQHDGPPASGLKPTEMWISGQVVTDRHTFTLDPTTPPGKYRLVAGMYVPTLQTRLPAFDRVGRRWPDDVIVLQEIVVTQ